MHLCLDMLLTTETLESIKIDMGIKLNRMLGACYWYSVPQLRVSDHSFMQCGNTAYTL